MTYLVIAAVPAYAASTCARVGLTEELLVSVDADDSVALILDDGAVPLGTSEFAFSVNGANFVDCGGTANDPNIGWVHVVGSDSGNEKFIIIHANGSGGGADIVTNNNVTIDLGNGNDTFVIENGDYVTPAVTINDPVAGQSLTLQNANNGTPSGDIDSDGFGDTRIDDAESVIVNAGAGNDDDVDGSDNTFVAFSAVGGGVTGDDVEASTTGGVGGTGRPFSLPITFNGETGDDAGDSGGANDIWNGGPGDDEIDFEASPSGGTIDLNTGQAVTGLGTDTLVDIQDVDATEDPDVINGNSLDNDLDGNGGADVINGGAGDDGSDTDASGIDQTFSGGGGADVLTPGMGNDVNITGGIGDDTVIMEAALDGTDVGDGGAGVDVLDYGLRSTPTVINGVGGFSGVDFDADGDSGDSNEDMDMWSAFEGYITGSANDTLNGTGAGESFNGGGGDDKINGAGGFDYASYAGCAAGIVADMVAGTVTGCSVDTLTGIEGIIGTPANDTFVDAVEATNDYVGGDGDDIFDQGPQSTDADGLNDDSDLVQGDAGTDTVNYGARTEGIFVDNSLLPVPTVLPLLACGGFPVTCTGNADFDDGAPGEADQVTDVESFTGGSGSDTFISPAGSTLDATVNAGDGNNVIMTSGGNDTITTGAGNDTVTDGGGTNVVTTGAGNDLVNMSSAVTMSGDDMIDTGDGDDVVGDALLTCLFAAGPGVGGGGQGDDTLDLGAGDDAACGGSGNDEFVPGDGDDFMSGNDGNDEFSTLALDGADIASGDLGYDSYSALARTDSLNLTSDATCFQDDGAFGEGDGLCFVEKIVGGSGDDFIAGDNANNILQGSLGDDNIQGLKGRDLIQGQGGDDRLTGGKGPDVLKGGPGFDNGNGGPGADTCTAVEVAKSC